MQENSCLKLPQISNQLWGCKNEQHLNMDQNFDHKMSLSKSKCWYSNNCLHFIKCAVPFHWAMPFQKKIFYLPKLSSTAVGTVILFSSLCKHCFPLAGSLTFEQYKRQNNLWQNIGFICLIITQVLVMMSQKGNN